MAESERVGFEAYFETAEFERGVGRFLSGLGETKSGIGNLVDIFGDFSIALEEGRNAFSEYTDEAASFNKKIGSLMGALAGGAGGTALGIPLEGAHIGQMLGEWVGGLQIFLNMLGPAGWALKALIPIFNLIFKSASSLFSLVATVGKTVFTIFGNIASIALKGVLLLVGSVASAIGGVLIGSFVLLGKIAKEALSAIIQQFKELWHSAVTLQTIEIGLGAVTRAALVMSGQFESATDAIGAAIPITEKLLEKLTEISLSSPFSVEDINTLFRTIAAYGIALGTAVDLTEAMIDLGSATGFSNTILERIARNFAQVARNGKIFQRDIYELANAGVDLHAVLKTQLNVTVEEMNAQLASGEKSVLDLISALEGFSKQYYGGSAEALSRSIQGLQTRFKTLGTVMVNDFVRPLLSYVAPALETIFDGIAIVAQTGVFEKIGQMVANMAGTVTGYVNITADNVAQTILKFILWLLQTTNKMIQYGYNMMTQWGYGMLRGAADAITAVANFINSALSRLFETHSPPRILPLIDVWGAGLIEAWLEGMTHADFGILNDIVSSIESVFRHLNIDEDIMYQQMQNVARMMSEAFASGSLDGGILSYIENIAGPFGKAIAEFTSLQFELAAAIEAVEIAQKALDDAFNMYEEADENVQRLVREYNELLRAGASDEVLDEKLKEINAEQDKRQEAALLIEKREDELSVAEENRDILEDQVSAQKELVSLMLKLTKPIEDAEDAAKKLGKEIADAGASLEHVWGGLGDLTKEEFDFSPAVDSLMKDIESAIAQIEGNFAKLWKSFMKELGFEQEIHYNWKTETWDKKWVKTGEGMFDTLGETIQNLFQTALNIDWANMDWDTFKGNFIGAINEALGGEGEEWSDLKDTLKRKLRDVLIDAGLELPEDYDIGDIFSAVGEDIGIGILRGISKAILGLYPSWYIEFLNKIIRFFRKIFGIDNDTSTESENEIGKPFGAGILNGITEHILPLLPSWATELIGNVIGAFKKLFGIDGDESEETKKQIGMPAGKGVLTGISDAIINALPDWFVIVVAKIITALKDLFGIDTDESSESKKEIGAPVGRGILKGVSDAIIEALPDGFVTLVERVIGAFKILFGIENKESSESKDEIGEPVGKGILSGIWEGIIGDDSFAGRVWDKIKELLGIKDSNSAKANGEVGKPIGEGILAGIWEGIKEEGSLSGLVWSKIKEYFGIKDNESSDAEKDIGNPIGEGILEGIKNIIEGLADITWSDIWNTLVKTWKTLLGIASPSTVAATELGMPVGEGILAGIAQGVEDYIGEKALAIWTSISSAFKTLLGIETTSTVAATEIGKPVGEGILKGILDTIVEIVTTKAQEIWNAILNAFKLLLGIESPSTVAATEIGTPIAEGILNGMVDFVTENIITTAGDIWTDISTEFNKFVDSAFTIGQNILGGLLEGIADFSIVGSLTSWAAGIIDKIKKALQDESEEDSPSKLFAREVGAPLAQGILVGMTDEMKNIKKDMFTAVNDLMNYQPTPTSVYTPSTINTHNITYNMNMGGNYVRDDIDIAMIVAANKRAIKQASYGV